MALFNMFDVCGKIIALVAHNLFSPIQLLLGSILRLVYMPLMLLCILPKSTPILSNVFWQCVLSGTLGITNGYFGSVPMIRAPMTILDERKELTGNLMMFSYSMGLTVGSLVSYIFDGIIGHSTGIDWCQPLLPLNQTTWPNNSNSTNNSHLS
jgi:solute carrier family 29 (equilibrative nucleoside transporter), member 4